MSSRVCMNGLCGASSSNEWRKGWSLRSGEFAHLCDKCGSAYEQLVFCDTFHSKDTGWRECTSCGKRLHCGCIASSSLLELLDNGGVKCIGCANSLGLQLDDSEDCNGLKDLLPSHNDDIDGGQIKEEKVLPPPCEVGPLSSILNQASVGSSETVKADIYKANLGVKDGYESLAQTNLTIALAPPSGNPNAFPGTVVEDKELRKLTTSFQQVSRSRHLLPKPPKSILPSGMEANAALVPQIRVARPPAEGRVKNQLLPRYWPRITDQELQQISGEYL